MDSTGEHLHPNWRALATIQMNLKRFVREGVQPNITPQKKQQQQQINVVGGEIKEFYDDLVKEDTNKRPQKQQTEQIVKILSMPETKKMPFDKNQLFRAATTNNVAQLENMDFQQADINCTDTYGWTALMMASCEGSVDAVQFLIALGANTQAKTPKGQTAFDLAAKKGHTHLLEVLQRDAVEESNDHESESELTLDPFYCDLCKLTFTEATRRQHDTSTLHQFNEKSQLPPNKLHKFNIAPQNRGLQLMVKQGWDKESGLGPQKDGRLYPIKTCIRKTRSGLGVEQAPARVTHFQAFDKRAVQRNSTSQYYGGSGQHRRRRSDMKREKVREWKRERRLRNELS